MTANPKTSRRLNFPPNSGVMNDVRQALATGPGTPAEIWRRAGRYALSSIRQALLELIHLEEVTFDGPNGHRIYKLQSKRIDA